MNNDSKNIYERNAQAWESMPVHIMHPDINLIKTHKRLFPDIKGKKILYIGFGEGQNLLYFVSQGAECFGTELTQNRIDMVRARLDDAGFFATLVKVNSPALPFENGTFDIVIAWQSLYYNNEETLKESLREIYRALKPGGQFLSSMVSIMHNLCAEEIAPSVFRPSRTPSQQDCILYCFKDEDHIKQLYAPFADIRIGYYDNHLFGARDFHYVISCSKHQ